MNTRSHSPSIIRTGLTRGLFGLLSFLGVAMLCAPLGAQPYGRPGPEGYGQSPYSPGYGPTDGMTEEELEAYHTRRARQLAREYQEARDAGRSLPGVGARRPVVVPAPPAYARGQEREAFPFVYDRRGEPVPFMPYGNRPVPAPVPVNPQAAPPPDWVDPYEQLEREQRQPRRERFDDQAQEPQRGFRGWFRQGRNSQAQQEQPDTPQQQQQSNPRQSPQRGTEGDSQPVAPQRESSPPETAGQDSAPQDSAPQAAEDSDPAEGALSATRKKKSGGFDLGKLLEPPTAKRVPDSEGMVYSPFAEGGDKKVDVRGLPPGTEVKDPYTDKTFIVP